MKVVLENIKTKMLNRRYRNIKYICNICLVIALLLGMTACGKISKTAKLQVENYSWNGWSAKGKHVSDKKHKTYEVAVGDEIELGEYEGFTIRIRSISDKEISFTTNTPMCKSSKNGGGINLNTDEKYFQLKNTESLKLVTPTMDGGEIFIFTVMEIH